MNEPLYKTYSIDELYANYGTVSFNKCGICLCRQGDVDILMNNHSYHVEQGGGFTCIRLILLYVYCVAVRILMDILWKEIWICWP